MLRIVASRSPRSFLLTRSLATHTTTTTPIIASAPPMRHDWTKEEVKQIYHTPLLDLVFRAACVHRQHQDPSKIQLCTLMNIKSEYFRRGGYRKNRSESDLQVEAVAKTVRSIPIDPSQSRAHIHQAHTAHSHRDTQLRPRPPVFSRSSPC